MKRFVVAVLVVMALLAVLAVAHPKETYKNSMVHAAMIGGVDANRRRFPWYVGVGSLALCAGTLIAPNVVLTAAHCRSMLNPDKPAVQFIKRQITDDDLLKNRRILEEFLRKHGLPDAPFLWTPEQTTQFAERFEKLKLRLMSKFGEVIPVSKVVARKQYIDGSNKPYVQAGDIMILILERPSKHMPIKLAESVPAKGQEMTLVGMGQTYDPTVPQATNPPISTLQRVALTYVPRGEAPAMVESTIDTPEHVKMYRELVARPEVITGISFDKKGGCGGDSGGPLIIKKGYGKDELVGVVSFGPDRCNVNAKKVAFSAFASVPYYLPWIRRTVKEHTGHTV